MLYRITDELTEIKAEEYDESCFTAAYLSREQLSVYGSVLGLSESAVQSCHGESTHFRSGVEVYDDYTFTELRIADIFNTEKYDCVALYIKKNLIIVVDVEDPDYSTKEKFISALKRYPPATLTLEKLIAAFLDALITNDTRFIEDRGNETAGRNTAWIFCTTTISALICCS